MVSPVNMETENQTPLTDIQKERDHRELRIDKVGVRGLRLEMSRAVDPDWVNATMALGDTAADTAAAACPIASGKDRNLSTFKFRTGGSNSTLSSAVSIIRAII